MLRKTIKILTYELIITGVTFSKFGSMCGGRSAMFSTNPSIEDTIFPTEVSKVITIGTEENSWVDFKPPSLG